MWIRNSNSTHRCVVGVYVNEERSHRYTSDEERTAWRLFDEVAFVTIVKPFITDK